MPHYGGPYSGFFYQTFDYGQKLSQAYQNYPGIKLPQRLVDIAVLLDEIVRKGLDYRLENLPSEEDQKVYADFLDHNLEPISRYFKPYVGQIDMTFHHVTGIKLNGLGNVFNFRNDYHNKPSHVFFDDFKQYADDHSTFNEILLGPAIDPMTPIEKEGFTELMSKHFSFNRPDQPRKLTFTP